MLRLKDPTLLRSRCLIDGAWVGADDGRTLDVTNPASGETIASVPLAGAPETRRAIAAAERAMVGWKAQTAETRARVLRRWFDLMKANQEDLAIIMTSEQGKPLAEARGEIAYAAAYVEWFAEEARRVYGDLVPSPWGDKRIVVTKEPVGVCAAITPWNFPSAMITRKVAPALAAGCTIVVKPASQTPLSALALGELALRAGVPAGAFSIVTGSATAIGGVLTASQVVRKLTFIGSTEIGRVLAARCAPTSSACRSNSAATRPSSCSTMPISMRPWRARSPRSSATPARPASAPTGCWCGTASTNCSPRSSARR